MKTWDLKRGDVVVSGGREFTFDHMEGMYAHWADEKGEVVMGNFEELEKLGDKFYPTK